MSLLGPEVQLSHWPQVLMDRGVGRNEGYFSPLMPPQDRWVVGQFSLAYYFEVGSHTLLPTWLASLCCPGKVQCLLSVSVGESRNSSPVLMEQTTEP